MWYALASVPLPDAQPLTLEIATLTLALETPRQGQRRARGTGGGWVPRYSMQRFET